MKPAGASTPTCSGCGRVSRRDTTVYAILPGRGLAQAAQVIGARLCRRAAARRLAVVSLLHARPRIRRVSRICCAAVACCCSTIRGSRLSPRSKPSCRRRSPRATAYHAGTVSAHGLAVARGHYVERLGRLLERTPSRRARVRRFQQHLIVEFDAIFSFLFDPTLDATNWRAEHALRPAVVTRKMCGGGNRTAPRRRQSAGPRQRAAHRRSARPRCHRRARHAAHRAHTHRCRRASERVPAVH